jgi:hypothetical protein
MKVLTVWASSPIQKSNPEYSQIQALMEEAPSGSASFAGADQEGATFAYHVRRLHIGSLWNRGDTQGRLGMGGIWTSQRGRGARNGCGLGKSRLLMMRVMWIGMMR